MKTLFLMFLLTIPFNRAAAQISSAAYNAPPAIGLCILGAQSGKFFNTVAAFRSIIWKNDIIYMGETPGQASAHLAQLEALKAMRQARGSKIAVGFEIFNIALQPVLDAYASGAISEDDFLRKTGWEKELAFDFRLYRPLFDFIRENKLRALALNLPNAVISKITRSGVSALSGEERTYLPDQPKPITHIKYAEYLKKSFAGQGAAAESFTFENYLAAISASNEAMAKRLADFIRENPSYSELVITANSHVVYNAGVPAAIKAFLDKPRQTSFYTESGQACPARMPAGAKDTANYIWYLPAAKTEESPAGANAKPDPGSPRK